MSFAPNERLDLHIHTSKSDGRLPGPEVLDRAIHGGLHWIAITDHDATGAVRPGLHVRPHGTVRVIGGAEISGVHEGMEFHLLVYFPGEVPDAFLAFCRDRCQARASRYESGRTSLAIQGVPPADDSARSGERALTRLHLAQALVEMGHTTSIQHAFDLHLATRHGHVPAVELTFVEAISIARAHGGLTSWAHPTPTQAERHLPAFVEAGLQGLEVLRPQMKRSQTTRLKNLAKTHGLFVTGGSDWHGWNDPDLGRFAVEAQQIRGFLQALTAAA